MHTYTFITRRSKSCIRNKHSAVRQLVYIWIARHRNDYVGTEGWRVVQQMCVPGDQLSRDYGISRLLHGSCATNKLSALLGHEPRGGRLSP